jgi:hypothetical protein
MKIFYAILVEKSLLFLCSLDLIYSVVCRKWTCFAKILVVVLILIYLLGERYFRRVIDFLANHKVWLVPSSWHWVTILIPKLYRTFKETFQELPKIMQRVVSELNRPGITLYSQSETTVLTFSVPPVYCTNLRTFCSGNVDDITLLNNSWMYMSYSDRIILVVQMLILSIKHQNGLTMFGQSVEVTSW